MLSAVLAAAVAAASLDADLRAVAALPGEPSIVAAAGLARDDQPILTLENRSAFDPASTKKRAVVVGADDATAAAVVEMARWFKRDAPRELRNHWDVAALPYAAFDPADKALQRWLTFQSPDVVIEIVNGDARPVGAGVADAPNFVIRIPVRGDALGSTLRAAAARRSALREMMVNRVSRQPIAIATLLARHYPDQPGISYIPSVSWVNTLKLSAITGDRALEQKVRDQAAPWLKGAPLFGQRIQLTSIAGTMIFAELGGDALPLARRGAELAAARKPDGVAEYGQGWTDDMFMASAILARVGRLGGEDARRLDEAGQLLIDYAAKLQRPDGVFIHAVDGPHAWGRGNGFAAFGLMETLTALPANHPQRSKLLDIYRRHMTALKAHQSPDGMWREVIDEPGAYREETATAMLMTAMSRGIRLGWLDRSFMPFVERAWRGVAAHVKDDGTIVDVCTGTGAGPTKKYYLDRAAITGADDRGGAMALFATMEWMELLKK